MPDPRHDIELPGCTPEPLMAYLKALGVLRLVSEQADPNARGWWRNDVFWLRSCLDRDALVKFFLEDYQPTPIVAPWAGGSGFFKRDNKKAVTALCESNASRCKPYANVIRHVQRIIRNAGIDDKPGNDDKVRLIRRYRRELPDEMIAWMDAAMVIQQDGQSFAPLLGTGGNDGRLDFTQNFMQRVVSLGLHENVTKNPSAAWLDQSLFSVSAKLSSASVGQFAPGRAGGPNATQGLEGDSTDNPWDFILMIEGTLLLAGAAVRRLGVTDDARVVFPFTVRTVAAGFDSSASKDKTESRGELWLPLWNRPTSTPALRHLFSEGRAEISGRAARDGVDFARAISGLGIDRGITEFNRLAFLKRNGKAFLASPLGRLEVVERGAVDLLREIDPWLDRFRSVCATDVPARFSSALRAIDSAIFDFCRYGGKMLFQNILISLGRVERELALTPGKVGQSKNPPDPLAGLSRDWIDAANDNSTEFMIALSLAAIHDPEQKIGTLRANLEPVREWYDNKEDRRKAAWADKDRAVVWNAADLPINLAAVLTRRMMDANRNGCAGLPLASAAHTPLSAVAEFIDGDTDDQRIEELLRGLMLVDHPRRYPSAADNDPAGVPAAYALLKLLFLPHPLIIERRDGGRVSFHYAKPHENGIRVRPEPRITHLLQAQRLGQACMIAMRRLRASGLAPMPRTRAGRTRDTDWLELDRMGTAGIDPTRLAAALVIPIDAGAARHLLDRVTRPEDIKAELNPQTR